ncbi:MAG: uroporphyrinogen decarboxylase family protein [Candidatus Hodarchaeales archaeon]|jgi:uroporphyrinogen decarboxylase
MNSRERVLTTLKHKEPDSVPLLEVWIESEIIDLLGGDPYLAREKLRLDCLPLGSYPKNSKAYGHGVDEWGRLFRKGQYKDGLIKNYKDLEKFTAPLSHAKDWFPPEKITKIKKKYQENYAFYFAWHDCSLGLTYLSMGIEEFFLSLYNNPEFVKAVIKRSTEWIIALVEQVNTIDIDFIVLGDDAADNSRPMISPRMFREFILPEYKKIVTASDVPIIWHSDGNIKSLIPMIIEAGFIGIHSLEPKVINLAEIKAEYGEKLVLAGNLDTTDILCKSNLNLVRKDVERCIKEGASGGGYFFSSSNSLFEGHDLQAILEAYRYARKIGKYPITI